MQLLLKRVFIYLIKSIFLILVRPYSIFPVSKLGSKYRIGILLFWKDENRISCLFKNVTLILKGIFLLWCASRKFQEMFWILINYPVNSKKRLFSDPNCLNWENLRNTRYLPGLINIRPPAKVVEFATNEEWSYQIIIFFFFMRRVQKKQAHAVKVGFLSQRSKINKSFLVLIQAK